MTKFLTILVVALGFCASAQNKVAFNENTKNNFDTIYKYKNYKLALIQLTKEGEYNYILIVYKNKNGKQTEFFRDTIVSEMQEIKFVDYNNDSIKDILVQNISDVRSNLTYYLYLVDPTQDKLRKVKGFEEIKNPEYISKYNLISNVVMSGRDWTSFYKIKGDSIKDFGIVIYDEHDEGDTYTKQYNKAIQTILKHEKRK